MHAGIPFRLQSCACHLDGATARLLLCTAPLGLATTKWRPRASGLFTDASRLSSGLEALGSTWSDGTVRNTGLLALIDRCTAFVDEAMSLHMAMKARTSECFAAFDAAASCTSFSHALFGAQSGTTQIVGSSTPPAPAHG